MEDDQDDVGRLIASQLQGKPPETIDMLTEIFQEHPDAVLTAMNLIQNGWSMIPTGHSLICITLRSCQGDREVLGHGNSHLDAFEELQRKTANFTRL